MTGKVRWTSYSDDNKHPEDSLLLAYLRKQQLADGLSISQHIDVEKCPRCLHKLNELMQVSTALDVLGEMRSYQHYPELTVADTYARMQSAANRRIPAKPTLNGANYPHRSRQSAVRWVSLPAAFGLAILFTMAMLVFANLMTGKSLIREPLKGSTSPGQNILTVVVPAHSTLTPDLTATVSAGGSAMPVLTPTPNASSVTRPYIEVCSTSANIAQRRLVICGYNFDSTHKAILFASGKKPMLQINLHVDQHGKFQFGWIIVTCSYLPTIINAYEVTSSKTINVKLQITSFGSCPAPISAPITGPSRLLPNYSNLVY
jgi:hypothetical protein